VSKDITYEDKVTVVIVCDGYTAFNKIGEGSLHKTSDKLTDAGIYDESLSHKYCYKEIKREVRGKNKNIKEELVYSELGFMDKFKNEEEDNNDSNSDKVSFETHNLVHCFSRKMTFQDFLDGFDEEERQNFFIDDYEISNYMLGNDEPGKVKEQIFEHIPLDVHFVIKHKNRGKIESHLFFFKGFCTTINPEFAFIIDAGTVALWKSISKIIFYMETFPKVGGASGEIEVMLPEKNEDGSSISFFQSILLRSQYVEYKLSHYVDKAAESLFGFVSVLPGAFSCFRWKAIEGEPLKKFLKGQKLTDSNLKSFPSCSTANMYL